MWKEGPRAFEKIFHPKEIKTAVRVAVYSNQLLLIFEL